MFSNKLRRRRSVKRSKSRKLIRKNNGCNHSRSFSCYHYEQTVIINGKNNINHKICANVMIVEKNSKIKKIKKIFLLIK